MEKLKNVALILLVIGGLVWGLVGLYQINLVTYVFDQEWIIRVIYVIFGLAVIYHLIHCKNAKKTKGAKR